jgi:hypothetical protein
MRGTVALNSEVCDDYTQIVGDAVKLGWEFMGYNQGNSRTAGTNASSCLYGSM